MRDYLHSALKLVSYYRFSALALVLTAIAVAGAALSGCRSIMTSSPLHAGQQVSEGELPQQAVDLQGLVRARLADADRAQSDALAFAKAARAKLTISYDDIERQRAQREAAWAAVSNMVQSLSTLAPPGVGTIVLGALGLGSILLNLGQGADGRRKDKRIRILKGGQADT